MKDWLKGLGKMAVEAGAAKLDDERQRWAEPPLTADELNLYGRYQLVHGSVLAAQRDTLPPFPGELTNRNRREARAFLTAPSFADVLALGEQAHADKKAAERQADIDFQERRRQQEAANKARDLAEVSAFYGNELNAIEIPLSTLWAMVSQTESLKAQQEYHDEANRHQTFSAGIGAENMLYESVAILSKGRQVSAGMSEGRLRRTLRDFPDGHRAVLRLTEVLMTLGLLNETERYQIVLPLVWNDGKSQIELPKALSGHRERTAFMAILGRIILAKAGTAESAVERVQDKCRKAMEFGMNTEDRAALQRHLYSGAQWLTADAAAAVLAPKGATDTALRLGGFQDGRELLYDLNESLATIAAPGSGKTTSQVIRNLLYLKAPAVVLDIKGEVYAATAAWRRDNVGPVYRFAPTNAAESLRFNPFDFISLDPDLAYEQSERLAELLTTPPDAKRGGDSYWDERAVNVIGAYVLHVALTAEGRERSMNTVLDMLAGAGSVEGGYDATLADMALSQVPRIRRLASALMKLPEKQLEGIFETARNQLSVWETPSIARLTQDTTFTPDQLRAENATLYLCVDLPDVKRFSSVLRVLLGMTILHLCSVQPEAGAKPVTVFLDEMPRLKKMDVVETALDAGRGFGVRMWLFMQNFGQLETAYPNAKGLLSNCLARIYMNPDEDTAAWLSRHLGEQHGLLDGQRKPLVAPHQLTCAEYADKMVVMFSRLDNATLAKRPFYADQELAARIPKPVDA